LICLRISRHSRTCVMRVLHYDRTTKLFRDWDDRRGASNDDTHKFHRCLPPVFPGYRGRPERFSANRDLVRRRSVITAVDENFTNRVRRGIRFAIQLLGCCRRSNHRRRRSRETSSARASYSIGRPNGEIRELTFNPTLACAKRKTLLLLFIILLFILLLLLLVMKMIIGRYALIMTIYYYGKHDIIHTWAHARTPRKQLHIIVGGRTLQATVNAADGPKRVRAPDKWSHCRRRLRLLFRRRSNNIENHRINWNNEKTYYYFELRIINQLMILISLCLEHDPYDCPSQQSKTYSFLHG